MSNQSIALGDAQAYLERVIDALRQQPRSHAEERPLVATLDYIARYVQLTRREIASLRAREHDGSLMAGASDELGTVVNEAANATHEILTAAEAIDALVPQDGGGPAIREQVTRIYTACAFQDITGQRISRVVRTLEKIEARVAALAMACGGVASNDVPLDEPAPTGDAALLHGPQSAGAAPSQDEIDKLFAEL